MTLEARLLNMIKTSRLKVEETLKLYERAMQLQREGIGYKRASKLINISKWTLANWMCRNKNPLENINLVNLQSSRELSYIVGVCKGDGTCFKTRTQKSYRICLASKDLDFVQNFKNVVKKILIKNKKLSIWEERGNFYKIQICSKHLYEFLKGSPLKVAEDFPEDFLRGFFDSEGWIDYPFKSKYWYAIRVCCSNSDKDIIEFVQKLLFNIGIISRIYVREKMKNATKTHYVLRIHRLENIEKFANFVGFSIKRKKEKLMEALEIWSKERLN